MSFNISSIANQAFANFSQIGGFAMSVTMNPFQAAEKMISQMAGGFGMNFQNFFGGGQAMQPTLPSPQMAQIPQFNQGGQTPTNLASFQGLFQQIQGLLQQLMGMGQFGGMQQPMQQLGNNLAQVGQNGMFTPGLATPTMPYNNPQAGFMNNMINMGNLMGFAAGGMMFNAQLGFSPSRLITETSDKYSGLKNGMGDINEKTNLAQVPEARIALAQIMEKGGNKNFDEVAKELKEKYGIDAKVVDVEGKDGKGKAKGIEITTADGRKGVMADGNGNNVLDSTDYKFKEASADVMKQYGLEGLKPEDAVKAIQQMAQPQMSLNMQLMGGMMGGIMGRSQNYMDVFSNMLNPQAQNAYGTFQNNNFLGALGQQPSMPTNNFFYGASQFAMLASQAYQYMNMPSLNVVNNQLQTLG
jgi:hypothetical protein